MNDTQDTYAKYALCREMLETVDVVRNFDPNVGAAFKDAVAAKKGLFLTGEGSSRIFPAKRAICDAMAAGDCMPVYTEGATQAQAYTLENYAVFGASNSGKTKEVVRLLTALKDKGHDALFGLVAYEDTPVGDLAAKTHVLGCGKEDAVAATKSVIEQGLFYDSLVHALRGTSMPSLAPTAEAIDEALRLSIPGDIVQKAAGAGVIHFAGRNNGVAEELTLKTNEITRKKSDYLEGTYAVHGIEEVMNPEDVVIVIDPFPEEEEKFEECLVGGIGMSVFAIASRDTRFPTIRIPDAGHYRNYIELAAGWNLLVEIGLALNIDLDKPVRARKVGNEYVPDNG